MKAAPELIIILLALPATASGLTCHKCLGTRENCTSQEQICTENETVCMEETRATYGPMSETLKRGCATTQHCQLYFAVRRGFVSRSIYCCSEDLCNAVPYNVTYTAKRNGLECYTCIGSLGECRGTAIPTAQCRGRENRCVEIFRQWLPGTGLVEPIIKGCGDYPKEERLLAYSIGSKISYVAIRICEGSKCNNNSFPEFLTREPNGLECYSCLEEGNGECNTENLQPADCMGTMDHCMTVLDYTHNTRIRAGCANQELCQDTTFYGALMPKLPISYMICCQSPFCNGDPDQGERSSTRVFLSLLMVPLFIALN
ncbi:urokinase plasminogen activator surface receptor-like [Candoia aspera]|uniref:urokinase plasminogen activator surface receptor-like n=1 Tax=Candoia aspera TaxID=51853 RepID=UPI002FD7EBAA